MSEPVIFRFPVAAMGPGSHSCTGSWRDGKQTLYVDGVKWTIRFLDDSRLPRTHRRWHAVRRAWLQSTARHVNLSDEETPPSWWGRWRWTVYHLND